MSKAVANQVVDNYYMPNLKKIALARFNIINKSIRVAKSGAKQRNIQALGKLWKGGGEVIVGLSYANGNFSSADFLYLWNFEIRHPLPSEPLEPNEVFEKEASIDGARCRVLGNVNL